MEVQLDSAQGPIVISIFVSDSLQCWWFVQSLELIKLSEEKLRAFLAEVYQWAKLRSPKVTLLLLSFAEIRIFAKEETNLSQAVLIGICREATNGLILRDCAVYPFTVLLIA